jgi:hypothetical protein
MSAKALFLVAIAPLLAEPAVAQNAIHFYRYDLPTPSCAQDPFRGELSAATRIFGFYHRVETDPAGRLISSTLSRPQLQAALF